MTMKLGTHWGHLMPSKNQLWIFKMADYFDEVSTTLRNTVKFTIFWYILLTGVVQSSPNTSFQERWFLLANTTWKWQKVKNYWKKRKKKKKKFRGFFSIWRHPRKSAVQGFPKTYFQQFFYNKFQTVRKSDFKNFKSI